MTLPRNGLHNNEEATAGPPVQAIGTAREMWPPDTQQVSWEGDAVVVKGGRPFDLPDFDQVQAAFPGRRVTLDGDVITVWPRPGTGPAADEPHEPFGGAQ
ncbi:hypothetical protein DSC45_34180 [Streptomyces sp. YIM 130001]|uniref:hypothetical protein n=1 Tax=Streptomyces sp. YIM 130001 TaxID=2259644 RepID=UPI000E652F6F|nr:hypothetical protein [Streptomyces sp. YIM 130001]RII07965.1 hypothetical protein DSC45_34180 [Streptomyces sp. YIM 130001]